MMAVLTEIGKNSLQVHKLNVFFAALYRHAFRHGKWFHLDRTLNFVA